MTDEKIHHPFYIAENDTLNLYLGKDNNIQAVKKETTSSNHYNIIGNYYIEKNVTVISVKNNAAETLKIQLLDQVPVFTDNENVKFNLQNIEQAVYNKNEGSLMWNFQLSPNESKLMDYKYEIKMPKNDIRDYKPMRKAFRRISCP